MALKPTCISSPCSLITVSILFLHNIVTVAWWTSLVLVFFRKWGCSKWKTVVWGRLHNVYTCTTPNNLLHVILDILHQNISNLEILKVVWCAHGVTRKPTFRIVTQIRTYFIAKYKQASMWQVQTHHMHIQYRQTHTHTNWLGDLDETTGCSRVKGCPALVVPSVHVATALHKKLHHLSVLVDASLEKQNAGLDTRSF